MSLLLKRTVINYAIVICLAMAAQFLLNLLTFIGLFGFYYCHRPLCMRYRCIELRRLYSFGGCRRFRAVPGSYCWRPTADIAIRKRTKKEGLCGERIGNGTHRSRCGQFMMYLLFVIVAAYPAVYGQFPQAIPQPMTAVAPTQREGKYNTLSSTSNCWL